MATKLYKNKGKLDLVIPGVGELKAGEQVSLSGEHLPVIILENFPGLEDATDEVMEGKQK